MLDITPTLDSGIRQVKRKEQRTDHNLRIAPPLMSMAKSRALLFHACSGKIPFAPWRPCYPAFAPRPCKASKRTPLKWKLYYRCHTPSCEVKCIREDQLDDSVANILKALPLPDLLQYSFIRGTAQVRNLLLQMLDIRFTVRSSVRSPNGCYELENTCRTTLDHTAISKIINEIVVGAGFQIQNIQTVQQISEFESARVIAP